MGAVVASCWPTAVAQPRRRGCRVVTDPAPKAKGRRVRTDPAPRAKGRRVTTDPAPKAPGRRSRAESPRAPGHHRPRAESPRAPGHDRPRASRATAPAHDSSHVTPPPPPGHPQTSVADPPAPDHDGPPVTHPTVPTHGLYGRTFTADEVQRLVQAATAPLLDAEVRLLQALIQRLANYGEDPALPEARRRAGASVRQRHRAMLIEKLTVVGRAVDVLQRTLKTRKALATDTASALYQLLDEAAAYIEDDPPPAEQPPDEHGDQGALPSDIPTFKPLKTRAESS